MPDVNIAANITQKDREDIVWYQRRDRFYRDPLCEKDDVIEIRRVLEEE